MEIRPIKLNEYRMNQKLLSERKLTYKRRFITQNNNDNDNRSELIPKNINKNKIEIEKRNLLGGNIDDINTDDINQNFKIDDYQNSLDKQKKIKKLDNDILNNNSNEKEVINYKLRNRLRFNKRFLTVNSKENNNINKSEFLKNSNNQRINEVKNPNKILFNNNNDNAMINRRPNIPELSTDIKSDEIKNELIFQKSSKNLFRKKIDFKNEDNKIENKINNQNENENEIIETPKKISKEENNKYRSINKLPKYENIHNKYSIMTEPNRKIQKNIDNNFDYNKEIFSINNNKNKNTNSNENNNTIENKKIINDNIQDINDDIGNLNINEIINQKNENNTNNTNENNLNKIIENNNNGEYNQNIINRTKTIDNEKKRREIFARKRYRSLSNINIMSSNIPIYCKVYENINIFNSILISLNNNSLINKYFQVQRDEQISQLEKNNQYCLSSILYYLNKFLWQDYYNLITKSNLIKKYKEFIKIYSESNCPNLEKDKYCYDINNMVLIVQFIYHKINEEFSQLKKKNSTSFDNKYDPLNLFLKQFYEKNKSFIIDNFVGFFQNETNCSNCQEISYIYNRPYFPTYNYSYYSYFNFDLNEIYNYNNSFNNNFTNNKNFNLDNCLNYTMQKLKINNLFCNNCLINRKYQSMKIFSLSNIFTIILSNNNYNFIIQDEIDLTKYACNYDGKMEYSLISILCQINQKEFILYNFNYKNGLWYAYENGKISNVEKMDINAIPLILIYQLKSTMEFEYKNIKIEEIVHLKVKFSNGRQMQKMGFPKYSLIKNVYKRISEYCKLDMNKIKLLINSQQPNHYELLSKYITNTDIILVLVRD